MSFEIAQHKAPRKAHKSARLKRLPQRPLREHQQLRFNPIDPRRSLHQLQQMMQQRVADRIHRRLRLAERVHVPNHRLGSLANAERIPHNVPRLQRNKARKNAAVQVLEQHVRGAAIVPVQPPLPALSLVAQQWPQLRRGEVAKVQDLELRERDSAIGSIALDL